MNFNVNSSPQDGRKKMFLLFAIVRVKYELLLDPDIQRLKPSFIQLWLLSVFTVCGM